MPTVFLVDQKIKKSFPPEDGNIYVLLGGACNIHFVFSLILPAIAAKHCIKLDILATSLFYFAQFAT